MLPALPFSRRSCAAGARARTIYEISSWRVDNLNDVLKAIAAKPERGAFVSRSGAEEQRELAIWIAARLKANGYIPVLQDAHFKRTDIPSLNVCSAVGWVERQRRPSAIESAALADALRLPPVFAGVDPTYVSP